MPKYHIVTDSSARFSNPRVINQYPITILPNKIEIGTLQYREDVDLPPDEILRLIASQATPPKLIPPSVAELSEVYANLARTYDGIISVHPSRELSESWNNARIASQQLSGSSCEIAIIDSRTLCAGLGMLVRLAGQGIQSQLDFEAIVKAVRGAVERVYSVYYVETLEYLRHNGIMSESRAVLGSVLGIKPFLSIEEGRLIVIEKVRTRSQATEQLVEFLAEFDDLDDAMIVQAKMHITEQTRTVQDRLSLEFVGRHFPFTMYGASLATLIGTDATGVVVLESEIAGLKMTFQKTIRIITDSVCDIPSDLIAKWDIPVIPCYVNYGGKSYADDGVELDRAKFYQSIPTLAEFPTTAAPSPAVAEDILVKAFEGYEHLIGIHVSPSLSSTYNNIRLGAQKLPQDRVTFLDGGSLSMGLGTQVLIAAEMAQQTNDVQEILSAIEKVRKNQKLYAAFFTLDYLKRSGRVNPVITSIGTLLQIKPIISAHDGKIEPIARIRTFGKALDYLYNLIEAEAPLDRLTLLHIQNEQGARDFLERLGNLAPTDTRIVEVGPTLGAHIGAGSIGATTLSSKWKA